MASKNKTQGAATTTSKTEALRAAREANAAKPAAAAQPPVVENDDEEDEGEGSNDEGSSAAGTPAYGMRTSRNGKKYYRWAGHLGPCMHRAIVARKFAERLDEMVKEESGWTYANAETEADIDGAHAMFATALKLLRNAAVVLEQHREFKPAGGTSSKVAAGSSAMLRERFRKDWSDVLDDPTKALNVKSLNGKKAVCLTESGERVIVPIAQLVPAPTASAT